MSILSTEKLSHSFHDRWLFRELHFGMQAGDRIALVGINGTGKSTLLKIMAGVMDPDSGTVVSERGIRVGYLPQEPDFAHLNTIEDFIYSADNKQQQLIKDYERLVESDDYDVDELGRISDELTALNAWEYEHQIKTILNRLQISDFDKKISSMSGGQQKRLALAKLLIDEPDVYILDEPTNHLDIETIEWLEKLLTSGNKTVLIVSHDRYFLDHVCQEIRELDRGEIFQYKGDYANFVEKKAERHLSQVASADKARNLWKKELEWMRRQPKARGTKSKSRIEAFYDLQDKSKAPTEHDKVQLKMQTSRQGSKIMEIEAVSKSFKKSPIISEFTYTFKKGDRIGLAGRNGSGKSTFLNLITKALEPDSGSISTGETTVIGYYKQGGLDFRENQRVIDVVKDVAEHIDMGKDGIITASQLLTQFLFPPEKQFGMVSKLSGGERKRLQLMRVLMLNPNFLILDEPSNDLDMDTLNILEDFLERFTGVLLLVTHDRYLLDKLTDQLFIFDSSGFVNMYNGNYADFKFENDEKLKAEKVNKIKVSEPVVIAEAKPTKSKISYKEQIEYNNLETEIEQTESEITMLSDKLTQVTDHVELSEIAQKIEDLKLELDNKSARWLELAELL
ncbi:ABC-F family ATP-binding cassette domain-containing protein [Sphingobacterium corticibacter]|uniref:ABC transporter n=1 Tax=Sphingobacterium corticibacter TaxID=2171749 RepID=A0A2T8HK32_9SPHI|nr:ABC-F family ATP-binding cassette domain-containing protein [Sphingobacterium corticibacter]PVH25817.1 ABC transporter [Sphingobacterium corticibacter]